MTVQPTSSSNDSKGDEKTQSPPAYNTVFAMPPPGAESTAAVPLPPPRQTDADEKTALQSPDSDKTKYTEGEWLIFFFFKRVYKSLKNVLFFRHWLFLMSLRCNRDNAPGAPPITVQLHSWKKVAFDDFKLI